MKPDVSRKPSNGSKLNIAPESDEIEVSVFGPGYGESILLHLGYNNWFIVDSCIDPISNEPAPLIYLNQINVNPSNSVKQVIATHWHDDHIRGFGKLVENCSSAEFVCSGALKSDEFLSLVSLYGNRSMMENTGVEEMSKSITVLQKRKRYLGKRFVSPKFATAGRCLWRNSFGNSHSQYECSIHSLSPSDAAILGAYLDIDRLLPAVKEPKRRIMSTTPNHAAVALWVSIGNHNILLGSDLEETNESNTGWSVIVSSTTRPIGKASFFKIPHHGSCNAHHPQVWTEMLEEKPIAVLTPYEKGNHKLPTREDVNRICSLTDKAYSTATIGRNQTVKRDRIVEKTIRETVRNIRQLHISMGHVRLRTKIHSDWRIEIFGDALPLKGLYVS